MKNKQVVMEINQSKRQILDLVEYQLLLLPSYNWKTAYLCKIFSMKFVLSKLQNLLPSRLPILLSYNMEVQK